jgi:hypothetical protein
MKEKKESKIHDMKENYSVERNPSQQASFTHFKGKKECGMHSMRENYSTKKN